MLQSSASDGNGERAAPKGMTPRTRQTLSTISLLMTLFNLAGKLR